MFITIHSDLNKLSNHWQTRECGHAEERKVDASDEYISLYFLAYTNCALSAVIPHNFPLFSLAIIYARINKNIRSVYHVSRVSVLKCNVLCGRVPRCACELVFLSTLEGGNRRDVSLPVSPPSRLDRPFFFFFYSPSSVSLQFHVNTSAYLRGSAVSHSLSQLFFFSVLFSFG